MDTKKLRQKILDLAIRGKLVPQDPNDEPASVLLERIRAEKERLIKEGKIKRSKKTTSDTPHYENKTPFEVPEGWEWVRLEDYLLLLSGQDYPPQKYNSDHRGIPYIIGASNIENEQLSINRWTDEPSVISTLNDVLVVCKGAGVGKIAMNNVGDVHIARQIQAIRDETGIINSKFIKLCIASNISEIIANANRLIPGLKRELLLSLIIPVAPIEEQERIVNAVEQWFTLVDTLEKETDDLSARIRQTKSKILDLAILGKLVPQDPNDEPAIELLKRINPKFTPCDNAHYENVPSNWALSRVEDIGQLLSGRDLTNDECNYENMGLPYLIGASNIEGDTFSFIRWTEKPQVISQIGDILISCKGTIGTIVKNDIGDMHIARQFMAIRPNTNCITSDYLHICLIAAIEEIKKDARGVIPGISRDDILTKVFTIPPLNEQRRIVAAMNLYHRVLDNISANL